MPTMLTDPCNLPTRIPVDEPAPCGGLDQFNQQGVFGVSEAGGRTVLDLSPREHGQQAVGIDADTQAPASGMRPLAVASGQVQ